MKSQHYKELTHNQYKHLKRICYHHTLIKGQKINLKGANNLFQFVPLFYFNFSNTAALIKNFFLNTLLGYCHPISCEINGIMKAVATTQLSPLFYHNFSSHLQQSVFFRTAVGIEVQITHWKRSALRQNNAHTEVRSWHTKNRLN